MMSMVDMFAALGDRLRHFGCDERSKGVCREAMATNEWFSHEDIMMAVDAISRQMLSREKLLSWASHYPRPTQSKRVGIIMAGNLPLVGFFDLLCVLMSGHTAVVKPSSKDLALTQYIIDNLRDISANVPIETLSDDASVDMLIATGGDTAARYFRSHYPDIPTLIRGSRHSVAVLSGRESAEQMQGLRRDIYSYSGLGCRNVSLLFVPRGWSGAIPQPEAILEMKQGNYLSDKALLTMLGVEFEDLNGVLAIESSALPESISRIHYSVYDSLAEVERWLVENDAHLQCVVSQCVAHSRRVDFGCAQYPTLWDYADGVDVMEFLTT